MNLPVNPPVLPMLAKNVSELPPDDGWIFEPKWDGFRALVFRDGGEIVIAKDGDGLDFELLQLRLHPAASRVKLLAAETPASIVFFDVLCEGDRDLCKAPFHERRAALESILAN